MFFNSKNEIFPAYATPRGFWGYTSMKEVQMWEFSFYSIYPSLVLVWWGYFFKKTVFMYEIRLYILPSIVIYG